MCFQTLGICYVGFVDLQEFFSLRSLMRNTGICGLQLLFIHFLKMPYPNTEFADVEFLQETNKCHCTMCPKSMEPIEILFIIYIICSICSPRHSPHFLSRFTMFVRILLNLLGSTVAHQSVILRRRWRRSRILTAYTGAFRNPQNAKSPPFHPMLMKCLAFKPLTLTCK
jgi:hypothetical protein